MHSFKIGFFKASEFPEEKKHFWPLSPPFPLRQHSSDYGFGDYRGWLQRQEHCFTFAMLSEKVEGKTLNEKSAVDN